jgi:predicted metal-dependent TIM-barrel fold hydrolase
MTYSTDPIFPSQMKYSETINVPRYVHAPKLIKVAASEQLSELVRTVPKYLVWQVCQPAGD